MIKIKCHNHWHFNIFKYVFLKDVFARHISELNITVVSLILYLILLTHFYIHIAGIKINVFASKPITTSLIFIHFLFRIVRCLVKVLLRDFKLLTSHCPLQSHLYFFF